jgi:hypothetical protein
MATFPADYTYLGKISTVVAQVSGTNTGFTALITEASLATGDNIAANVFSNTENGGGDVRFSSDLAGGVQLPVEIISWDTAGSTCQLWTKLDVNATTAVDVHIWGNVTSDTQPAAGAAFGSESVWDNEGFASNEGATDVTGNNTPVNSGGVLAVGPFGNADGAREFDPTGYIMIPSTGLTAPLTLRSWFKVDVYGFALSNIIQLGSSTVGWNSRQFGLYAQYQQGGALNVTNGSMSVTDTSPTSATVGVWRSGVVTLDGSGNLITYLNGQQLGTGTSSWEQSGIDRIALGASGDSTPSGAFPLSIAEPRFRRSVVTSDFIATEYNNQSAPNTFWTATAAGGGGGGLTVSPTGITSEEVFGDVIVAVPTVVITTTSIESEEVFGLPSRQLQNTLTAVSISSTEAVGEPSLLQTQFVTPISIASTAQVGAAQILSQTTLVTSSILSTEIVGDPYLMYNQVLTLTSLDSTETFGFTRLRDETAIPLATMYRDVMGNVYRDVIGEVYDIRT